MRTVLLASVVAAAIIPFAGITGCDGESGDSLRRERQPGEDPAIPTIVDPPPAEVIAMVGASGLRRLSIHELDNTLRDLLRDESRPAGSFLPADVLVPFDNDYTGQVPSAALVDGLETLAFDVAERAMADASRRTDILGCSPSGPADATCMESFVRSFGRRALRRPLTDEEVARFVALQSLATEANDFNEGAKAAIAAFLQHPEFLYRPEIGIAVKDRPDLKRVDNWNVVTRLSFFLWGSTPNDALLDAADDAQKRGHLIDANDVKALVTTMLSESRAKQQLARFHAMWLGFDEIPHEEALAADMERETSALISRVVFEEKKPWRSIFSYGETFLTPALASHYGLPAPSSAAGGWVSYGSSGRQGLLSHGSFLSVGAKFGDTNPTFRGLAIRTRLLCQTIPPPPANVEVDDPPQGGGTCKWDQFAQYRAPGCVNCHNEFDPIGWGLEQYDRFGKFRAADSAGCSLTPHARGSVPQVGEFSGPGELGKLVSETEALRACAVEQIHRLARGRTAQDSADKAYVEHLRNGLNADFRFAELLEKLVGTEAFLFRRTQEEN